MPDYRTLDDFARRFGRDVQKAGDFLLGSLLEECVAETDGFAVPMTPEDEGDLRDSWIFVKNGREVARATGAGQSPKFEGGDSGAVVAQDEAGGVIDSGRHRQKTGKLANLRMVGSEKVPGGISGPTFRHIKRKFETLSGLAIRRVEARFG